jgi:hypothetical protein
VPVAVDGGHALTAAECARYAADGFLIRERVFEAAEVEDLRDAAECTVAAATERSRHGRTYWLDGKRFVDVDGATVQFEHARESETHVRAGRGAGRGAVDGQAQSEAPA